MKKLVILISSLIVVFSLFLFFYFRKSSYKLEYSLNDINIQEIYYKEQEIYQIIFNYKGENYSLITQDPYTNQRKLITDIKITEEDGITCIESNSKKLTVYPVCSTETEYIVKTNIIESNKITDYDNYTIYDYDNKNFLLWNYNNFIYLNNNNQKEINLFSKDFYILELITIHDNYLVIPDYNDSYTFDRLYLIDANKGKTEEIDLRFNIYFDSYFLGSNKNRLYLYDLKSKQEYFIDLKKEKIYKTDNKILINNEWIEFSHTKMNKDKPVFENEEPIQYFTENNILYYSIFDEYNTKITDLEVNAIIKTNFLDVYFLSKDTIYKYNPTEGVKALIKYSEWEFNYKNMIFIFD